ncbi:MAG: RecB-family nuclease [Sulfolobaceae archaeon]|jgi:SpoU rRNA methylase family enzyme
MVELIIVLHNVSSSQKLIDFAKLAFQLNIKHLVVTKVGGVAAQAGLAEVSKIAYKLNKSFLIFPDLKDAIDLLSPDAVYLITQQAKKEISQREFENKKRIMLVFSGLESGFNKLELSLGEAYKLPNFTSDLPATAMLAVLTSCIISGEEFKKG